MLGFLESPADIAIVILVVLVLFGGSNIPKLARNLGRAQHEFKKGLEQGRGEPDAAKTESVGEKSSAVAPDETGRANDRGV
jgi:sec-independent protein translocase protein TatA